MKIGILTFHNADNYGAVLQCYALQEHLKMQYPDCEVNVIDYRNNLIEYSYKIIRRRNSLYYNITQYINFPRILKKRIQFKNFRNKYLNIGTSELSSYDVIYYGSDQIWNTTLTGNDLIYFGKNFEGKKIAYGASDGGEMEFSDEIKKLLNSFSEITCRESTLSERIKNNNITVPVKEVCDPVFLLSNEQWKHISVAPKYKGYILAYKIADRPDFDNEVEELGKKLNKPVIQIVYLKSLKKMIYKKQHFIEGISPEQFVGYFANADFVITTSFHGTAFSIIFGKPLFVLSFGKRSERITELLVNYKLENRYISSVSEISNIKETME